jgi:hypothetical protein
VDEMKLKKSLGQLISGRIYLLKIRIKNRDCINPIRFGLFKWYTTSWVSPDADPKKNMWIMPHEVLKVYGPLPEIEQDGIPSDK